MKQIKTQNDIAKMFDTIAGKYDFLNNLLSLRQDVRWRNHLVARLPSSTDARMLDVATGTGEVIKTAVHKGTKFKEFIGSDISSGMLDIAKRKIKHPGVKFRIEQATEIEEENESLDAVCISFGLRNVVEPHKALDEFSRVIRKGGKLIVLEFFKPKSSFMNFLYSVYFRCVLPIIGGMLSNKKAYEYLPESVQGFMTVEDLSLSMEKIGFKTTMHKDYLFGNCSLVCFEKV